MSGHSLGGLTQHYVYSIWDGYWKLLRPAPELCFLESSVATRLEEGKDYSVVTDKNGVKQIVLSEAIISDLKKVKTSTIQPGHLYLVRWLWRAFKEETLPIFHFLTHVFRVLISKQPTARPLLITIGPDLAELFSNDKEVNDTLRDILNDQEESFG